MKISQFPLGEYSAGDAKNIPEGSARAIWNLTYENEKLTRLKGFDDVDSGLINAINANETITEIWAWKPALKVLGRGEYYYIVYHTNYKLYIYYQIVDGGAWTPHEIVSAFNENSKITIFATADSVLLSDGYTSPKKIFLMDNGDIEYLPIGLVNPTFKPTISNAQYTEEIDQSVFSEAGMIRTAITFVDRLGIESNPSQISDAYNAQRFSYNAEGLQQGYVKSIFIDGIVVPEGKGIVSVNIYTQVTKFSEGEDASSFTLAVNYPVSEADNGFTVYSSGTYTTLISYTNDVLKSADNISETSGRIVVATGDQIYSLDDKFRYLQPITLQNVNNQTFIDKPVRLRLYAEDHPTCPPNQTILNFEMEDFEGNADLDHICIYDEDLTTILDVLVVSRGDRYMEIAIKLSMLPSVNKKIYLAFTPAIDRDRYTGIDRGIDNLEYGFSVSGEKICRIFKKVDVFNVDTDIACWGDGTLINNEHVGRINLANNNIELSDYWQNLYNPNSVFNPIPCLIDDMANIYVNNRNYLRFGYDDTVTPSIYTMIARFDYQLSGIETGFDDCMEVNNRSGSEIAGTDSDDRVRIIIRENAENHNIQVKLHAQDEGEDETNDSRLLFEFNGDQYGKDISGNLIVPFLLVWSVKWNNGDCGDQEHQVYLLPLYNNPDYTIFDKKETQVDGEREIWTVRFGSRRNDGGITSNIGVTNCLFINNILLDDSHKEAIRCMANYMPLYLSDVIGMKFGSTDGNGNSHFSQGEQVDMDNLPAYDNYIVKWTDVGTENFADANYHKLTQGSKVCIPIKGFYNNQYVPTMLLFTENTISRLVFSDTGDAVGRNELVGEYSGYGCDDAKLIDKYGDVVYWYNRGQKQVFAYNGEKIINLSLDRVEFTEVTKLFVNNATRSVIVVDVGLQRILSIEKDRWTSATGLKVTSETDISGGKSLVYLDDTQNERLRTYPHSTNETEEITILQTRKINGGFNKFDRVKADFEGGNVKLYIGIDFKSENPVTVEHTNIIAHTSYGGSLFPRVGFIFFTLTGLDSFASMDYEIRRY